MDAFSMLKKDHDLVKSLFTKVEKMEGKEDDSKDDLIAQIVQELEIHSQIEEEIFYPTLRGEESNEELQKKINEALEEHKLVDQLLEEIADMEEDPPEIDAKLKVMIENVRHHIEEEENEVFKLAKKALSKDIIDELGERMMNRKHELMGAEEAEEMPGTVAKRG